MVFARNAFAGSGMTSVRTRERLFARLAERGICSEVLNAMREVPRHIFLDEALAHRAYEDVALPISRQQTISQPYMVAWIAQLAIAVGRREKLLEIGTGSGYQAAVMSFLFDKVYSVERINSLQRQARRVIASLGRNNIYFKHGDGRDGWQSKAPFDSIIVTAATSAVPPFLFRQLADGGRMIIPVGYGEQQYLYCYQRDGDEITSEKLDPVKFVPLLGSPID